MRSVRRELFVPKELRREAYDDTPLPIGSGQTISQPYIVAFMIETLTLRGGKKVLEIGAGSGYAAAVLAEIASAVFTIERIGQLAERAAANLAEAGCDNVHVRHADGTKGWSSEAPFDVILVSAGAPDVPKSLMRQLRIRARMVVPVGSDPRSQELIRITRVADDEYEREDIADVRFVPLSGKERWESEESEWQTKPHRVVQSRPGVSVSLPGLLHRESGQSSALELDRSLAGHQVCVGAVSRRSCSFADPSRASSDPPLAARMGSKSSRRPFSTTRTVPPS
jgi:protein-L-isoaspartate(D-aspartate) O-methyltransferase